MCTSCTILTKIATFAPSLLHIRAIALPIPRPAPVTRTRWPAKRAEDIIMEVDVMGSMMISRIDSNFDVMEVYSRIFEEGILQQQWATARRARATGRVVACACLLSTGLLCSETFCLAEKVRSVSVSHFLCHRKGKMPFHARSKFKQNGPKTTQKRTIQNNIENNHHQSQHHGKRRE